MTLKVRVIPTLLWTRLGLVKGAQFNNWRRIGSVLPSIKIYDRRDVDELILLDIDATKDGTELDFDLVEKFSQSCSVPLTVGGGLCKIQQIERLFRSGADKVSLNTVAFSDLNVVSNIAELYGRQSVICSIDVRKVEGGWRCFSNCGSRDTGYDAKTWAKKVEASGAGEILLTSIDRDGTMSGYDVNLISHIVDAVNIPVIASGGAGTYQHLIDAVSIGGASAVAAASMFQFTEQTPREAKIAMQGAGIPVRIT